MSNIIEKISKVTVPVIPTRGLVAFPTIGCDVELERQFSIEAAEVAERSDRLVFLVCQKDASVDSPALSDLYGTGTLVKIRQAVHTPDGTHRIIVEGLCRGTISSFISVRPFMFAEIMTRTLTLPDYSSDLRVEALKREAKEALSKLISQLPALTGDIMNTLVSKSNPGLMADFIAANILLRTEDKQSVLDEFDPLKRLELACVLMESELRIITLENDIHKRVREQIDDSQREFYLREQLKVIQGELGGGDSDDVTEYYDILARTEFPDEVREKLNKEIVHLSRTPFASPEAAAIRSYLDACIEFPWCKRSEDVLDIEAAEKILNDDHYGLEKVKERIIEFLAVKKLNPDIKSQIICLVGPPGVGKTSLGASVARSMNRKYVRVSLGGIRDEADIRGHRRTYVASMPGRIVEAITRAGVCNPVMLLDEIDKLCSDVHGDPASAMLEVLDPEQNKAFRDHFIELPVDLSECFFIATANSLDGIPRPLLDRMEIIELHTYTKNEKFHIAKEHLIEKQVRRHGLNLNQLRISNDAIYEIIDGYTRESGVRSLERKIAELARKSAKIIIDGKAKRVSVTAKNIKNYLGTRRYLDDKRFADDLVGVVNGLAYTEVGGDILKIESAVMNGTGKLELTGTLGDVMKESAKIGVSYIRANADKLGISPDFHKDRDIHIHVPEGAVPKDGPSAGVTMLTSLVSILTGRPVYSDIAMTGELTLTGRVLPIGGLREKTMAAFSAGVTRVIIPYDNIGDLEEIDREVREKLEFFPCKTAEEVLDIALHPVISTAQYVKKNDKSVSGETVIIPDGRKSTPSAYFDKKETDYEV